MYIFKKNFTNKLAKNKGRIYIYMLEPHFLEELTPTGAVGEPSDEPDGTIISSKVPRM